MNSKYTYEFVDSTEQFVRGTDEKGNSVYFTLGGEEQNSAYQEWANSKVKPRIKPYTAEIPENRIAPLENS